MTDTVIVPAPAAPVQDEAVQAALLARVDRSHTPTNPQPSGQQEPAPTAKKFLNKYDTPEQLEAAYKELQGEYTRMKQGIPPAKTEDVPPVDPAKVEGQDKPQGDDVTLEKPTAAKLDYEAFTRSVAANGTLSEADFKAIEAAGIPKEIAAAYVEGLKALQAREQQTAVDVVGGAEAWESIKTWAVVNLDDAALDAFNGAVKQGGATRDQALLGLKARFAASSEGALITGKTSNPGLAPFVSIRELSQAQSDKRYGKDAAYTREVEQRAARSTF